MQEKATGSLREREEPKRHIRRPEKGAAADVPRPLGECGELVTTCEAAAVMHISERQVARMCADGRLRAVKVGKLWRINRDALGEYLGLRQTSYWAS